jgi:hypothetical protein
MTNFGAPKVTQSSFKTQRWTPGQQPIREFSTIPNETGGQGQKPPSVSGRDLDLKPHIVGADTVQGFRGENGLVIQSGPLMVCSAALVVDETDHSKAMVIHVNIDKDDDLVKNIGEQADKLGIKPTNFKLVALQTAQDTEIGIGERSGTRSDDRIFDVLYKASGGKITSMECNKKAEVAPRGEIGQPELQAIYDGEWKVKKAPGYVDSFKSRLGLPIAEEWHTAGA